MYNNMHYHGTQLLDKNKQSYDWKEVSGSVIPECFSLRTSSVLLYLWLLDETTMCYLQTLDASMCQADDFDIDEDESNMMR